MKKIFFLLLFLPFLSFAQVPSLLFDAHFSPHASSPGLLFTQAQMTRWIVSLRAYEAYQRNFTPFQRNKVISKLEKKKQTASSLAIATRVAELYGFWGVLSGLITEIQYEVFGYGYRLRTFGNFYRQDKHFKFYGLNPKRARIQALFENQSVLSRHNRLLLALSGYESSFILAHEFCLQSLSERSVKPRQSPLYLHAKLSLYLNMLGTRRNRDLYHQSLHSNRQDWAHYFSQLMGCYSIKPSSRIYLKQLRQKALFSILLDPFVYCTLTSQVLYCASAQSLNLPKTLVLPLYQLSLSPFGVEDVFGGYFTNALFSPSYFYLKTAHTSPFSITGFGLESRSLLRLKTHSLGFRFDFWRQPQFISQELTSQPSGPLIELFPQENDFDLLPNQPLSPQELKLKTGFSLSCIYQWHFSKPFFQTFYMQLGYKLSGYLPGESTGQTPLFRLGLNLSY